MHKELELTQREAMHHLPLDSRMANRSSYVKLICQVFGLTTREADSDPDFMIPKEGHFISMAFRIDVLPPDSRYKR